jgi:DNA repair exonuclease SbcCD ATPase subunit
MLQIKRVVIDNFCQHEKVDFTLRPGILSLTGVNGAGKSNLIRALFYGLTGEVLGSDTRGDMLRWGAYEGSVTIYANDGEHDFTITRTIHNGKHKLESKKYGKLGKKTEVNELVSSLVGFDVKLLSQIVFVPQGKLTDLLLTDHSDRVRTMNRLFELDGANKLRDILQAFKGKVINHPPRTEEIKEAQAKVQESEGLLEGLQKEAAEIAEVLGGLEEQRAMFEATIQAPSYEEAHKEYSEKVQKLSEKDSALGEKQAILKSLSAGDDIQISENDMRRAHACNNLPILREQYIAANESLGALDKQRPELEPRAHTDEDLKSIDTTVRELVKKRDLAVAGMCSNCEQPYEMDEEDFKELESLLVKAQAAQKSITDAEKSYREREARYKAEHAAWSEGQHHVMAQLTTLEQQVKQAEELAEGFDIDDYNARVQAQEKYMNSAANRKELEAEISKLGAEIGGLMTEVDMCKKKEESAVPNELKLQAYDVLGKLNAYKERNNDLKLQESSLTATLTVTKEQLERYQKEEDSHEANTEATKLLEAAREILHPDVLPRIAGKQAVETFNKLLYKYLKLFHTTFTVEMSSDMDFRCGFTGKEDAPISALSGGQKVVAALAVRFALMELLTYGCGLLVLDEPTAYLDTDNKRALLDVLKEAGAHVKSQGITVVVPTHEEIVASACTEALTV